MKAIICTRYGPPDVLELRDVAKPVPGDGDVLIRIRATTAFPGDCEMRRFEMHPSLWLPIRLFLGVTKPRRKILGQEFAGDIESVGAQVTGFHPGEPVFGTTEARFGAYAEYVCLPATYAIARMPRNVSYGEAATLPVGGLIALHYLRKAHVVPGEKVLIYGAAGCVGTYAVQLARLFGAEVTAVDSAGKLDMLKSIGAHHVIDYALDDFTGNGERYDIVFDVVGKSAYSRSLGSLAENGRYLLANVGVSKMVRGLWTSRTSHRRVIFALAGSKAKDLDYLMSLVERGELRAVIDRTFPLADMADAHRYVESGQKQGHVVIDVFSEGLADALETS